jgi:hypothetical protein
MDPDPDPTIFVIDLQDTTKRVKTTGIFLSFSALPFEGTFSLFSKIKSHKEVAKQ